MLIFTIALSACSGNTNSNQTDKSRGLSKTSVCEYTDISASYLQKTRDIFESAGNKLQTGSSLKYEIAQLEKILSDYGQIAPPDGASTLQTLTAGTITSAQEVLIAFENGESGEREAELHLSLLKSATEEITSLRQQNNCR